MTLFSKSFFTFTRHFVQKYELTAIYTYTKGGFFISFPTKYQNIPDLIPNE